LQRAYAIPANFREKAVGVRILCADSFSDTSSNAVSVRKEIFENRPDDSASVGGV
jgi:hypothetical protein